MKRNLLYSTISSLIAFGALSGVALAQAAPAPVSPDTPAADATTPPAKKVTKLKNAAATFAKTFLKVLASDFMQGVLQLAAAIVQALDAIERTESALAGKGFVFTQQLQQTGELAKQVEELVNGYRKAGFHTELDKMIDLAKEIDKENPEGLYGSDALSTFCASVESDVDKHEYDCNKILDEMNAIVERAVLGAILIRKLFSDPVFLVAASASGQDVVAFMALQDFEKISGALGGPVSMMETHHSIVQADLKRIKENILNDLAGGGILDE